MERNLRLSRAVFAHREGLFLANKRNSGHARGRSGLRLNGDLQATMSASPPISSASPPGADLPDDAPVRLVVVESGCGAVAVGSAYLFPPLSSGGASIAGP